MLPEDAQILRLRSELERRTSELQSSVVLQDMEARRSPWGFAAAGAEGLSEAPFWGKNMTVYIKSDYKPDEHKSGHSLCKASYFGLSKVAGMDLPPSFKIMAKGRYGAPLLMALKNVRSCQN